MVTFETYVIDVCHTDTVLFPLTLFWEEIFFFFLLQRN